VAPYPTPSDRTLHVNGLVNARDLGGLRRLNGTVTPRGVFFRSENIDWVTPEGWEQLHAAGIRSVIDLRQKKERNKRAKKRPRWLHTEVIDLDVFDNSEFWKTYSGSGLVSTALYYLPHLEAMPERSVSALTAIVNAPPGGVLFHCMHGRDRTGMIAMLLLAAVATEPDEIVEDYLETVHRGELRAVWTYRNNDEPAIEAYCNSLGTSTEGAFRSALAALNVQQVLTNGHMAESTRTALSSWRGAITN